MSQIIVHDGIVGDQEILVVVEDCCHYRVGKKAGQHYRWQNPFLWKVKFDQSVSIISNSWIWSKMCSSGMPKLDLPCDGKRKMQGNIWWRVENMTRWRTTYNEKEKKYLKKENMTGANCIHKSCNFFLGISKQTYGFQLRQKQSTNFPALVFLWHTLFNIIICHCSSYRDKFVFCYLIAYVWGTFRHFSFVNFLVWWKLRKSLNFEIQLSKMSG